MLYMHSKLAIQTDRLRMFACCAAVYLKRTVEGVLARREKIPRKWCRCCYAVVTKMLKFSVRLQRPGWCPDLAQDIRLALQGELKTGESLQAFSLSTRPRFAAAGIGFASVTRALPSSAARMAALTSQQALSRPFPVS